MNVYEGIMKGLGEALEHAEGKTQLRTTKLSIKDIEPVKNYTATDIKQIRIELGVTQVVFAKLMGVSNKTVEAWECGKNVPDGAARRLLSIIQIEPKILDNFTSIT